MSEQFRFISKRTKKIEYRTLLKKELRFCQNKKCSKFIDPNEMAKPIDYSSYKVRKYCSKSCACSQRNRNVEYKQEWRDKQSATLIKRYEGLGVYYIPKDVNLTYKEYKKRVRTASQRTLKRLDRVSYDLYMKNAWSSDNTDPNALTIEHKTSVRQCYDCGFSIKQASNINNIEVITMKENWSRR